MEKTGREGAGIICWMRQSRDLLWLGSWRQLQPRCSSDSKQPPWTISMSVRPGSNYTMHVTSFSGYADDVNTHPPKRHSPFSQKQRSQMAVLHRNEATLQVLERTGLSRSISCQVGGRLNPISGHVSSCWLKPNHLLAVFAVLSVWSCTAVRWPCLWQWAPDVKSTLPTLQTSTSI